MTRTFSLICFLTGILLSPAISGQDLQFYREDILLIINKKDVETNAEYYFCNVGNKDILTTLFYPFPENTKELVDSIVVQDLKTNTVLSYQDAVSGIYFTISTRAYGQAAYRVFFRQKLKEGHFRYILNSTATWRRPLEIANYEVQMPVYLSPDSLNYPPDTSFINNNTLYFLWKKKDFMPAEDFEVYFH
jgi:hypothetical protein